MHGEQEDSLGAELYMLEKYVSEFIAAIESFEKSKVDKKLRKKLLNLKKSWIVEISYQRNKIIAAIESVLEI